jgi:Flp pilus assembly CpaE family ATPase
VEPDLDPFGPVDVAQSLHEVVHAEQLLAILALRAITTGSPVLNLSRVDPNDPRKIFGAHRLAEIADDARILLAAAIGDDIFLCWQNTSS